MSAITAPKGYFTFYMGRGKVAHGAQDSDTLTLCKKPIKAITLAHSPYVSCVACRHAVVVLNKTQGESDNMEKQDVSTEQGVAIVEQVDANIERIKSLAEAENAEGMDELNAETEALISSLSGTGSIKVKKEKRDALSAAATVKGKDVERVVAAQVVGKEYTAYEGVSELVTLGAEKFAEGVGAHIKTSHLAEDIAKVVLDMRLRLPNKDDVPDLKSDSDQAKKSASDMYAAAGKLYMASGSVDEFEAKEAIEKLIRATQNQMREVLPAYLRSLDTDAEEAARFTKLTKGAPEGAKVSELVAKHYDLPLKGVRELKREKYQLEKRLKDEGKSPEAIAAAVSDIEPKSGGAEATPDERVTATVAKLLADVKKAKPQDFEEASEEAKKAAKDKLDEVAKAVKAMYAAVAL